MFNPSIVRKLMALQGLTQDRLAALAGVCPRTIANSLLKDANPRSKTVAALARSLGVQPGELFDVQNSVDSDVAA